MRAGLWFTQYQLGDVIEVQSGTEDDPFHCIKRFRFLLDSPKESLGFGQPLTHIKIRRKDSWFRSRTYSLISPPDSKGYFEILVKIYKGGCCCEYLHSLHPGDKVYIAKTLTKRLSLADNVGLLAFGIGITEMVLTARMLLEKKSNVKLLYFNRFPRDILFRKELEDLEKEFPSSFKAVFVCSREEGPGTLKGKLDAEVIAQFFRDWKPEQSRFLAIGSKAMKNHAYSVLEDSGFHLKLLSKF